MAKDMTGYTNLRQGERNTAMMLVKSGKESPAEKWKLSPKFANESKLKTIFNDGFLVKHKWGGVNGDEVVIPMGRIVGVDSPVKDYTNGKMVTTMVLPGMTKNNNWIGVVPYNITKDNWQNNEPGGNQPAVITNKLVVLPYMPSVQAAATMDMDGVADEEKRISIDNKMPWGAVINPNGVGNELAIQPGDYLKATASGRFTKWVKGTDDAMDIVGQVYGLELDQVPHGFIEWVQWGDHELLSDAPFRNTGKPEEDGWGYDEKFKDGNLRYPGYNTPYSIYGIDNTGIPGLHDGSGAFDGFGINDTEYENIVLDDSLDAKANEIHTLQVVDYQNAKVNNLRRDSVTVKINGADVDTSKVTYEVDYGAGKVKLKFLEDISAAKVTVNYKMTRKGVPSYLDFKGVVGAVSVLLLK